MHIRDALRGIGMDEKDTKSTVDFRSVMSSSTGRGGMGTEDQGKMSSFDYQGFREAELARKKLENTELVHMADVLLPSSSDSSSGGGGGGDDGVHKEEGLVVSSRKKKVMYDPSAEAKMHGVADRTERRIEKEKNFKIKHKKRKKHGHKGYTKTERKKDDHDRRQKHERSDRASEPKSRKRFKVARHELYHSINTRNIVDTEKIPSYKDIKFYEKQGDAPLTYFVDTLGDLQNLQYGSLYRKDVPLYHRYDHRNEIKKRKNEKLIENEESNEIQGRFSHLDVSNKEDDGTYLSLEIKQQKRHGRLTEEQFLEKTREYNVRLRENPECLNLWLEYYRFQDELTNLHTRDLNQTKRAIAEKKLSILETALKYHPGNHAVLLELLKTAEVFCNSNDLLERWQMVLNANTYNLTLHAAYFEWRNRASDIFCAEAIFLSYQKCISRISCALHDSLSGTQSHKINLESFGTFLEDHRDHVNIASIECQLVSLLLSAISFKLRTGDNAAALSILQALLEYNFFSPENDEWPEDVQLEMFEQFWTSGAAAVGEESAFGWGRWIVDDSFNDFSHGKTIHNDNPEENLHNDSTPSTGVWRDITDSVREEIHGTKLHLREKDPITMQESDMGVKEEKMDKDAEEMIRNNSVWLSQERNLDVQQWKPHSLRKLSDAAINHTHNNQMHDKVSESDSSKGRSRVMEWKDVSSFCQIQIKSSRARFELLLGCLFLIGFPGAQHWICSLSDLMLVLNRLDDNLYDVESWFYVPKSFFKDHSKSFEAIHSGALPWWAFSSERQKFFLQICTLLLKGPLNWSADLAKVMLEVASLEISTPDDCFTSKHADMDFRYKNEYDRLCSDDTLQHAKTQSINKIARDWVAGTNFAKSLIMDDRDNLALWSAYATFEMKAGNMTVAKKVYISCFKLVEAWTSAQRRERKHQVLELVLGYSKLQCCLELQNSSQNSIQHRKAVPGDFQINDSTAYEWHWLRYTNAWPFISFIGENGDGEILIREEPNNVGNPITALPMSNLLHASKPCLEDMALPIIWWVLEGEINFQKPSNTTKKCETLNDGEVIIGPDTVASARHRFQELVSAAMEFFRGITSVPDSHFDSKDNTWKDIETCRNVESLVVASGLSEILLHGITGSITSGVVAAVNLYDQVLSYLYECLGFLEHPPSEAVSMCPSISSSILEKLEAHRCSLVVQIASLGLYAAMPPSKARNILNSALQRFPGSPVIIRILCALEIRVTRNLSFLRRSLAIQINDRESKDKAVVLWSTLIGLEQATGKAPSLVIRSSYEKALECPKVTYSPLLWRKYIQFEISRDGGRKLQYNLLQAINANPWSKELWMDAFEAMSLIFQRRPTSKTRRILQSMIDDAVDKKSIKFQHKPNI